MKLGYPCMNLYLRSLSENEIRSNRTVMKKTIEKDNMELLSKKCLKNVKHLMRTLTWNYYNNIDFYRVPSILPWYYEHEVEGLKDSEKIYSLLDEIGDFITDNDIRISFHPAHFVKIASDTDSTVTNSIKELEYYSDILNLMGLEKSRKYPINIHIGANYEGKEQTAERFEENYNRLNKGASERIVVENDDKESCWGVSDLINLHDRTGVPIVLDTLHHEFTGRGLSVQEAYNQASNTWNEKPVIHHSNSRYKYEGGTSKKAHSDWIYTEIQIQGDFDAMIEAKKKEQAVLKYKYDFLRYS